MCQIIVPICETESESHGRLELQHAYTDGDSILILDNIIADPAGEIGRGYKHELKSGRFVKSNPLMHIERYAKNLKLIGRPTEFKPRYNKSDKIRVSEFPESELGEILSVDYTQPKFCYEVMIQGVRLFVAESEQFCHKCNLDLRENCYYAI